MCFLSLRFFKCRFGFIRTDNLQFDRVFFSRRQNHAKNRTFRANENLKIIIFEFQSFEKWKFCGRVSVLDKGHLYISEKKSSKKKFIVVPYSKIDKNDLLTWTDYQQNKKVEFLTAIFTFHPLPKILSRDRLPLGMTITQQKVRVLRVVQSVYFGLECIQLHTCVWTFF